MTISPNLGALTLSNELESLSQKVTESVVMVRGSKHGVGSGVVWNDAGLIITNHHVATQETAEVRYNNGASRSAKVIARDPRRDLAALRVEDPIETTPATIGDSTSLKAGHFVVAVGHPHGEKNAFTLGIVSSTGESSWLRSAENVLQLSLTLRPGNSGGALADLSGRIMGIPNMVLRNGLSLAVPSHAVQRFLQGEQNGRLGISIRWAVLPESMKTHQQQKEGAVIVGVEDGGPAERAGLQLGDVILSVEANGETRSAQVIVEKGLLAGQEVTLRVLRGGELIELRATPTRE